MNDTSRRKRIEEWLAQELSIRTVKVGGTKEGFMAEAHGPDVAERAVRAALAVIDEDHRSHSEILAACSCGQVIPCPTKARHEAALARAIGV